MLSCQLLPRLIPTGITAILAGTKDAWAMMEGLRRHRTEMGMDVWLVWYRITRAVFRGDGSNANS